MRQGHLPVLALLLCLAMPALAVAACPPVPRAACRVAPKNILRLVRSADPAADRLLWKWSGGMPTGVDAFGDPTAATGFDLCVYDGTGLAAEIPAPAAGICGTTTCWRASGTTGFAYRATSTPTAALQQLRLKASGNGKGTIVLKARGTALGSPALPLSGAVTVQLQRRDATTCFESLIGAAAFDRNDAAGVDATATFAATTPVAALPSAACGQPTGVYPTGTSTPDSLVHDGATRTFRVYVPPAYDTAGTTPMPVVLVLHGGFGSGAQIEASAQIAATAAAGGFIAVSPDGVPGDANVRTWNGGGCCGWAAANDVDDVGFVAALLDRLEARLCLDRRRVYAMGMSNGAIMSYRLACELSDRIRAIGPVSGTLMQSPCTPARPVPVMHVHGTADANLPYLGGVGCGAAGVSFTPVPETIAGAAARNACSGAPTTVLVQGDGTCVRQGTCPADGTVTLCTIANGGHQWPGGEPPVVAGLPGCPFGYQSQLFDATTVLWNFFAAHPAR